MKTNKMRVQEAILLLLYMNIVRCENDPKEASKSKNPLPYFRRQVEGLPEDSTLEPFTDDLSSNLVSLLVKNAKEIFDDINGNEIAGLSTGSLTTNNLVPNKPKINTTVPTTTMISIPKEDTTISFAVMPYENLSLTTLLDYKPLSGKNEIEKTIRNELMHLTNAMKTYEKSELNLIKRVASDDPVGLTSISTYVLETSSEQNDLSDPRSCIFCNNIMFENCNDPQNKIIPSVSCEREGDLCYSQHTPFGIVDRGCYNVNNNLTTYVCSCNLCNYISISEMPYIFPSKQDWIDNVVELSRTRNFKKSVFKDMSCLRCEVNTTTKTGDMLNSANCLEGNIGNLPIQDCDENEICAVKAVRSDGYIWRGCVQTPLYNHWYALCDTDLCNYDSLVYIYDFV